MRRSTALETLRKIAPTGPPPAAGGHGYLTQHLLFSAWRARLLQRTMACLYLALDIFVSGIVVVGVIEVLALTTAWLLTRLALAGSGMLFYASMLLT